MTFNYPRIAVFALCGLAACTDWFEVHHSEDPGRCQPNQALLSIRNALQMAQITYHYEDEEGRVILREWSQPIPYDDQSLLVCRSIGVAIPLAKGASTIEIGLALFDGTGCLLAAGTKRAQGRDLAGAPHSLAVPLVVGRPDCGAAMLPAATSDQATWLGTPVLRWATEADPDGNLSNAPLQLARQRAHRVSAYGWGIFPETMPVEVQAGSMSIVADYQRLGYHRISFPLTGHESGLGAFPLRIIWQKQERQIQSCLVLNYYADTLRFLDGSSYTYQIVDEKQISREPRILAAGDLNGDQRDDLVVGNEADGSLTTLISRPSGPGLRGPFSEDGAKNIKLGGVPTALAVADLNGDSHDDVVVVAADEGALLLLMNQGTAGQLAAPRRLPVAGHPVHVAVADFNGDRQLDLAVAQAYAGVVSIWLNPGQGAFSTPTHLLPLGEFPQVLAAGDLDDDGDIDLIASTGGKNQIRFLLNRGDGSFSASEQRIPMDSEPISVVVADLNGDEACDIVVAQYGNGNLQLLLADPNQKELQRRFHRQPDLPVGERPAAVVAEDFNGDGALDLAVALDVSRKVVVFRNTRDAQRDRLFVLAVEAFIRDQDHHPLVAGFFDGGGAKRGICGKKLANRGDAGGACSGYGRPLALPDLATTNSNKQRGALPARGTVTVLLNSSD